MFFNHKQRFGIRKFTIGISSILLGSVLFIGVDSVAHASELNDTNSSLPTNSQSLSDSTNANQSNEANQSAPQKDSSTHVDNNDKELNNNNQLNSTNNSQPINQSDDKSNSYNTDTDITNQDSNEQSTLDENQKKYYINTDKFHLPKSYPLVGSPHMVNIGGGGVDVTPGLSTFKDDDTVNYNFTVSLSPIKASDHVQTAKTFGITVPKFVQNVQFKLIGTREEESLVPHNVNLTLGQISEDDYKNTNNFNLIPTYEDYLKLKNEGKNELPASIIKYNESYSELSGGSYNPDYAKSYGLSTLIDGSIGINVSYDITKEQFKKTPYMPLDARLRWKSSTENIPLDSNETGAQSLDNYRRHLVTYFNQDEKSRYSSYTFIEHPEHIHEGDFDENGLYLEPSIGVTKKLHDWTLIGNDISHSNFMYSRIFALAANPTVFL